MLEFTVLQTTCNVQVLVPVNIAYNNSIIDFIYIVLYCITLCGKCLTLRDQNIDGVPVRLFIFLVQS